MIFLSCADSDKELRELIDSFIVAETTVVGKGTEPSSARVARQPGFGNPRIPTSHFVRTQRQRHRAAEKRAPVCNAQGVVCACRAEPATRRQIGRVAAWTPVSAAVWPLQSHVL